MTELAGYYDGAHVCFLEGANIKKNQRLKIMVMDDFVDVPNDSHGDHDANRLAVVQPSHPAPFTEEEWERFIYGGSGVDPQKAAAFAALERLREQNKDYFGEDFDYKKELAEAIDEKFGVID